MVLTLVLGALGAGTFVFQRQAEQRDQAGRAVLFKAQQAFESELQALPEGERGVGVSLDVDSRFSKTTSELKALLGRTDASARIRYEASLRLGSLYLDYRHPDRAVEYFKGAADAAGSSFQKATAAFLLGTALEQSRMSKEAMETFQLGIRQNVEALKSDFLLGLVRVSLQLNDSAQAKTFSEQLSRELPKTRAAEFAKTLLKDAK